MRENFIQYANGKPEIQCTNDNCRWNNWDNHCLLHNIENPTIIHLSIGKTIRCDFYEKTESKLHGI